MQENVVGFPVVVGIFQLQTTARSGYCALRVVRRTTTPRPKRPTPPQLTPDPVSASKEGTSCTVEDERTRGGMSAMEGSDALGRRLLRGRIAVLPNPTLNAYVESDSDHPYRDLRESIESARLERRRRFRFDPEEGFELADRIGFPLLVIFVWFWCSWMSFGVWAWFFGDGPLREDEDAWPLKLYLGIPVAAAFGGLVVFVCTGGMGRLRRLRKT